MSCKRHVLMQCNPANVATPVKPIIRPSTVPQPRSSPCPPPCPSPCPSPCSPPCPPPCPLPSYAIKPCPTPPPTIYENLCLLEFMVNEAIFTNINKFDSQFLQNLGPATIQFRCDGFPMICICEDEFGVKSPYCADRVRFRFGKSCLFARPACATVPSSARIIVGRKMSCGATPSHYDFGSGCIKFNDDFLCALRVDGSSRFLKDNLQIVNSFQENTGCITVYLRLTNLGQTIYTTFQPGSDEYSVFKIKGEKTNDETSTCSPNNCWSDG